MVNTLTAEEIHKLLDTARVGRLGCIANGEPYVMPINYDFRDGAICERAEQRYPLPQRPAQSWQDCCLNGARNTENTRHSLCKLRRILHRKRLLK